MEAWRFSDLPTGFEDGLAGEVEVADPERTEEADSVEANKVVKVIKENNILIKGVFEMKSVEEILREVLSLSDDTVVDDNLCVDNCSEWDSMAQIELIGVIEDEYDVALDSDEAMNMDSVAGIKKVLESKGAI